MSKYPEEGFIGNPTPIEKKESVLYPGEDRGCTPPPAGPQPAMGRLVYRNYYAGDQPAVIGNMHGIDDSRLSSRDVLMDLIMRAGIQDGDEYLIAVTKIGPRFCDTQWRIGEGGRLERVDLSKNSIVPD